MSDTTTTDRIEKSIFMRAPLARVWRALTDTREFGTWFQARIEGGDFAPGAHLRGSVIVRGADLVFDMFIERIEPQTFFSYRWHPYPIDPKVDYSVEPTTLVEFRLTAQDGGTLLVVTESGFDAIPVARRDEAFRMNTAGWAEQLRRIDRYVTDAK